MQVLIVEDDAALGSFLQKGMKLEGHDVAWHMSPDAGTNVVDVYINYLRKKLGGESMLGDAAVRKARL